MYEITRIGRDVNKVTEMMKILEPVSDGRGFTLSDLGYDSRYSNAGCSCGRSYTFKDDRVIERYDMMTGRKYTEQGVETKILNGSGMDALVERGLVEIIGNVDGTFECYVKTPFGEIPVTISTKKRIYRVVHDIEWYKENLIKTLASKVYKDAD